MAFNKQFNAEREHDRTVIQVDMHLKNKKLVEQAEESTNQALMQTDGERRTLRESRKEEQAKEELPVYAAAKTTPTTPQSPVLGNKGEDAYLEMMECILVNVKKVVK